MQSLAALFVDLSGVRLMLDYQKYSPVMIGALLDGSYESDERGLVPRVIRPNDRIIEIGSAIGCVSMLAARVVGASNILCFDANPGMVADANSNFLENGIHIDVRNAVLMNRVFWAGENQTVPFHIHRDFWGSSLVFSDQATIETVEIPCLCLEEEIAAFRANVLICDIEGGEADLLTLADLSEIDRIMMEIHYNTGREAINAMIRKLILDGFSIDFDHCICSTVTMHRD